MAGISEEMRRKMRVDRQKGHVQAGNASWKGTAQGRGGGECMTHDMRDIWVFGWRLSSLTQEGSFLTADISFEIAAVVYAQKNAARKHIFFFFTISVTRFQRGDPAFCQSHRILQPADEFATLWHRRPLRWRRRTGRCCIPTALSKCLREELPERVLHHTPDRS